MISLNINGLLSKTDELRDLTNYIKPAILDITESKLGCSNTNAEVNINGCSIIRNDRNRKGGGGTCYIRDNLCFNTPILIPKVKPIAIGIFYRPSKANNFLNAFANNFQQIDNKTSEIYLLEDFNINLILNGKFIIKENQSFELKNSIS